MNKTAILVAGIQTNYVDYDLKKPKPWTLAAPTLAETHSM